MIYVIESLVESVNESVVGNLAVGRQSSIEQVFDYGGGFVQPNPTSLGEEV